MLYYGSAFDKKCLHFLRLSFDFRNLLENNRPNLKEDVVTSSLNKKEKEQPQYDASEMKRLAVLLKEVMNHFRTRFVIVIIGRCIGHQIKKAFFIT